MVPDRSEPFHVESLLALGEPERARAVLERLEERGSDFPRLWITATLPRTRALVLADEGEVDGALAELDALDLDAAAQLPFDLGWTLLVRGRLERRARRRRAAADSFAEALAIFERLGAPGWAEQARAELDRVGLRRAPAELTATERRVAELAAAGLTNREVAAQAFMSPKTVEANLARVYRKLGIRSRAELGARLAPTGARRPSRRPRSCKRRETPDFASAGAGVASSAWQIERVWSGRRTSWSTTGPASKSRGSGGAPCRCAAPRPSSRARARRCATSAPRSSPRTRRCSACSRLPTRSWCARRTRVPASPSSGSPRSSTRRARRGGRRHPRAQGGRIVIKRSLLAALARGRRSRRDRHLRRRGSGLRRRRATASPARGA